VLTGNDNTPADTADMSCVMNCVNYEGEGKEPAVRFWADNCTTLRSSVIGLE